MAKAGIGKNILVWLDNATSKPAWEIKIGDVLTAFDVATQNISTATVVNTWTENFSSYYTINEDLLVTTNELIYVKKDEGFVWSYPKDIVVGNFLYTIDGSEIIVDSVLLIEESIDMIALDTESLDNFFVTNNKVLVHNFDGIVIDPGDGGGTTTTSTTTTTTTTTTAAPPPPPTTQPPGIVRNLKVGAATVNQVNVVVGSTSNNNINEVRIVVGSGNPVTVFKN